MAKQHVRKTYTPVELQQAQKALIAIGHTLDDANDILKRLHNIGWRVVYAGKLQGEPRQGTLTTR